MSTKEQKTGYYFLFVMVTALMLSACGGGGATGLTPGLEAEVDAETGDSLSVNQLLAELDGKAAPAGVDAEVYASYKSALSAALSSQGDTEVPVQAPQSDSHLVEHLAPLASSNSGIRFVWLERLAGDFNQDGVVDLQDLLALVKRHNQPLADGDSDRLDQQLDANGDGVIDSADAALIARFLGRRIEGYKVYRQLRGAETFELVGTVARASASFVSGAGNVYSFTDNAVEYTVDYIYMVRPYYRSGLGRISLPLYVKCGSAYGMAGQQAEALLVQAGDPPVYADPDEVVLTFQEPPAEAQLFNTAYGELGGALLGRITRQPVYRVLLPHSGLSVVDLVAKYKANPSPLFTLDFDYLSHSPNDLYDSPGDDTVTSSVAQREASTTYSDPSFSSQWAMEKVGAETAWDYSEGDNVVIGIIDSGVLWTHQDLAGNCTGIARVGATIAEVNSGDEYTDFDGHGTSVSGAVAMVSANSIGGVGLAHRANFVMVKTGQYYWIVDEWDWLSPNSQVTEAIGYLTDYGADVINLSLGSTVYAQGQYNACVDALNADIVVIAAAGNDNTDTRTYPAAYYGVVGVGATIYNDTRWYHDSDAASNYGFWVDIAAPGSNVYTTANDGGHHHVTGTSIASPLVAAAAGLLKSWDPSLNNDEIMTILYDYAEPLSGPNNIGDRLDVGAALMASAGQEIEIACDDPIMIYCDEGGTGSDFAIEITNTGTDPLQWEFESPVGFIHMDIDSGTINPGLTAILELEYWAASLITTYSDVFTIRSNDYDEPVIELDFIFMVTSPEIEVPEHEVNIEVEAGDSATEYVTVTNVGTGTLSYYCDIDTGITMPSYGNPDFPTRLEQNESAQIPVTIDTGMVLNPQSLGGDYSGTLTIHSNDHDLPEIDVAINITVTGGGGSPEIQLSGATVYAYLTVNTSEMIYYYIENVGDAELYYHAQTTGPYLSCTMPPGTLAPGEGIDLEIMLTAPSEPGDYSEDFVIATNDLMQLGVGITVEFEAAPALWAPD